MDNPATFASETVTHVLKSAYKDERTKANTQAIQLAGEFARLFTQEAICRAADEAKKDDDESSLQVVHLQKILAQLMLDF
ncbi:stimulated by retinoic acid 13 [Gongronella butleri]|nr:stimulated by retinoic acid 13 [Gongronella butleri]